MWWIPACAGMTLACPKLYDYGYTREKPLILLILTAAAIAQSGVELARKPLFETE